MYTGLDPSRVGTPPTDKKPQKAATCVRDLIYSAIEMNLSKESVPERPQTTQDRPSMRFTALVNFPKLFLLNGYIKIKIKQ